jgi:outer membrane protein OmpA-like peptidoglycan-associated protein
MKLRLLLSACVLIFSVSCAKKEASKPAPVAPAATAVTTPQAFSFEFSGFKYKSSSLNDVLTALNSRKDEMKSKFTNLPQTARITVRGYADAKGPEAPEGKKPGNIALSERRAKTIAAWLVKETGLSESMILIQAKGSSNLKNSRDPYAAENRRVEVVFTP